MPGKMEKRYILDVDVADALCELIARVIVHRYSDAELNELYIADLEPSVERQFILHYSNLSYRPFSARLINYSL